MHSERLIGRLDTGLYEPTVSKYASSCIMLYYSIHYYAYYTILCYQMGYIWDSDPLIKGKNLIGREESVLNPALMPLCAWWIDGGRMDGWMMDGWMDVLL